MGDHRAHIGALKANEANRAWPLVVRRARPADRDAVLAFATRTWDGWDYIPHAWPVWLAADDGVLLVATVGEPADGKPPFDANGDPIPEGQPIAISRVALLSLTEGWVEGIRVDPRVRGLGVATDLQTAELHWLAAHAPKITRYATGARNEGSHRLGARHGFELLARYVSWTWKDPTKPEDDRGPTGFDEATRRDANRRRQQLLDDLDAAGLVARPASTDEWWRRLDGDPGFAAGSRLYEGRPWTMQSLDETVFARHVAEGEVIALDDDGWGLAIISRETQPAEDAAIHLGVVVGDPVGLARLVGRVQESAADRLRFRLPTGTVADQLAANLNSAGFEAWPWELHILGRPGPLEAPSVDPLRLVLADEPRSVIRPPF